ncbi:hypothetical protein THASP1DRAFT_33089 [Thamnocephalis sphaerospora]|uniref:Integral membrane protein n=1 Tax=Thamnocephalis sphaerospora TaxID=78915 RepID=A0A4P9XIQ6_9FUNG|nr:hypothetical protein THASP1DRAFT_33089 [Thamnocephalis sphaerospora]|eukprot:RKP05080.1 hypothetical protein THASP1DRAFT_33089 [Thamnocephalis sphaerospora]
MYIHPLGELNYNDYLVQSATMAEARERMRGLSVQLMLEVVAFCFFMRNFYYSIIMLYQAPRRLAVWCCVLQTVPSVTFSAGFALAIIAPHGPSCRAAIWVVVVGLIISADAANVLLLTKAYLVHQRNRWLLVAGILLIIPSPLAIWVIWYRSYMVMTPEVGCLVKYPLYFPWLKFGLDAPINIIFSISFLLVVYRQYRQHGSNCWKDLARDGLITMLVVVTSNLICAFGTAFTVLGDLSEMFWVGDWVVTSTLLVEHVRKLPHTASDARKWSSGRNRYQRSYNWP